MVKINRNFFHRHGIVILLIGLGIIIGVAMGIDNQILLILGLMGFLGLTAFFDKIYFQVILPKLSTRFSESELRQLERQRLLWVWIPRGDRARKDGERGQ